MISSFVFVCLISVVRWFFPYKNKRKNPSDNTYQANKNKRKETIGQHVSGKQKQKKKTIGQHLSGA
jgi:hypothetical protein